MFVTSLALGFAVSAHQAGGTGGLGEVGSSGGETGGLGGDWPRESIAGGVLLMVAFSRANWSSRR